jgi:hypothetical protein
MQKNKIMLVKNIFILMAMFLSFGCKEKNVESLIDKGNAINSKDDDAYLKRLDKKINEINTFLENKNGYNKEIAFMLDMKIASGKNRFFVVDLRNKKILKKGLVAQITKCRNLNLMLVKLFGMDMYF